MVVVIIMIDDDSGGGIGDDDDDDDDDDTTGSCRCTRTCSYIPPDSVSNKMRICKKLLTAFGHYLLHGDADIGQHKLSSSKVVKFAFLLPQTH